MMRALSIAVCVLVVVATGVAGQSKAGSLKGAWQVAEVTGSDGKPNAKPEPGLYLFTERHYSIMRVTDPRKPYPESATDQDKAAAFDPFIANSGTYEVKEGMLLTKPLVAKNPNVMTGPGAKSQITFDGADTVSLTGTNPSGAAVITKLRRVE